jgi:hypothetical protein
MDAPILDADQVPSPAQQLAMARRQHNTKYPTRPFEPPLARLLRIANDPTANRRVQVQAAAEALPFYHQPTTALPTTIALPPLRDVPSILRAQQLVTEAMSAGRIEPSAGHNLVMALAVMLKSVDITEIEATLDEVREEMAARRARPVGFNMIAAEPSP